MFFIFFSCNDYQSDFSGKISLSLSMNSVALEFAGWARWVVEGGW
jgi:hypothetical protein